MPDGKLAEGSLYVERWSKPEFGIRPTTIVNPQSSSRYAMITNLVLTLLVDRLDILQESPLRCSSFKG